MQTKNDNNETNRVIILNTTNTLGIATERPRFLPPRRFDFDFVLLQQGVVL